LYDFQPVLVEFGTFFQGVNKKLCAIGHFLILADKKFNAIESILSFEYMTSTEPFAHLRIG
jgi:hypothetical protein